MIYKIEKKRRKSVTSPPCNSERSKEPLADLKDEKQVQKDIFKNIPAPSSLNNKYTLNKIQQQEENNTEVPIEDIEDEKQTPVNRNNPVSALSVPCSKYTLNRIQQQEENDTELCRFIHKELEELIKDLECLRQKEDDVIGRFEASGSLPCHLDYSNKKIGFQEKAMQNREAVAHRNRQLEGLRELSASFRQNPDEATRRFQSKTSGSLHYQLKSYIKQPMQLVAPVAFKEERSSHKERETLNIPVSTGSLENEEAITTEGGFIEIEGTGVSLIIPPGAFEEKQLIKMRIVLDDYQDKLSRSFGSNSSVVVELLPSNLKLQKPAKLTLPHCLVLEKGCELKAKIYTSLHEEGNQPFWEEDPCALSELHEKYCVIWLQHFSRWKFIFGIKKKVKGKRIILYAARGNPSSINSDAYVDVGFYLDLPGGQQAVDLKTEDILRKQHVVFYNKDELPLTIWFEESSSIWTYKEANPKQISFGIVAEWNGCYSTFLLKVQENSEIKGYSCYFKAGQGTNLVDLKFPLEICLSSSESASGAKTANIKQPPAAEETMETSSSAETATIPSDLCSTHLSISRGELTSGPPLDFPATSTCYKCIALLKYVALHIAAKWWDVGRNLKLTGPHVNIIKADNPNDCKEQSYQMLIKWIDKFGSGAKFMVLGKALEDDGNLLLKQQLEKKLKE